jgi:hypothetical protein
MKEIPINSGRSSCMNLARQLRISSKQGRFRSTFASAVARRIYKSINTNNGGKFKKGA